MFVAICIPDTLGESSKHYFLLFVYIFVFYESRRMMKMIFDQLRKGGGSHSDFGFFLKTTLVFLYACYANISPLLWIDFDGAFCLVILQSWTNSEVLPNI